MRVEYVFENIKIASSTQANQGGSSSQNLGTATSPSVRKQGSE